MKGKLYLAAFALVMAIGLTEGLARWSLRNDQEYSSASKFYENSLALSGWEAGNWMQELAPHPFFGFTLARKNSRANNFGFASPHQILLYEEKNPGEFVIGIFGGSVAMGWGDWVSSHTGCSEELKRRIPKLRAKKIKILNLALAGYKQPQQFIIASYFLEKVDLFLNLDGRNEIESYWSHPLLPLDFPTAAYLFFRKGSEAAAGSGSLAGLSSISRSILEAGSYSRILGDSALFFLAARASVRAVNRRAESVTEAAKESLSRELSQPGRGFYEQSAKDDPVNLALRSWTEHTLRQSRLLGSFGKKAIFFLQPNQYLPGSKPLSAWEQDRAVKARFLERSRAYTLLPPAARRLRSEGVNMHDLTMIFSETAESVYIDDCCHLNALGNEIMTREIVERIVESVKF